MVEITELDEKITFKTQLEEDVGAVILINKFSMNPEDVDKFLKIWASAAEIAKKLPGVISLQLYRGIAGSGVFVAYVVFESTEIIKQLYNSPDFQSKISEYPASIMVSPHIFKKVAVPTICVD
jgi:heme-degrading monooxygenase HmoA